MVMVVVDAYYSSKEQSKYIVLLILWWCIVYTRQHGKHCSKWQNELLAEYTRYVNKVEFYPNKQFLRCFVHELQLFTFICFAKFIGLNCFASIETRSNALQRGEDSIDFLPSPTPLPSPLSPARWYLVFKHSRLCWFCALSSALSESSVYSIQRLYIQTTTATLIFLAVSYSDN